jgi:Do/DeqQ family serine protease
MIRIGFLVLTLSLLCSCNSGDSWRFLRTSANGGTGASSGRVEPSQPISGHIAPEGNVVSYADTVDRVAPAVVTVHSALRVREPQQFQFRNDPFFNWFFGNGDGASSLRPRTQQGTQRQSALGSGVIVRNDGYILTNDHVVDGAQDISVDVIDRRTFKAKLVGADRLSDLAVLKIDASNLPVLALGNSDDVRVGDVVLAVGNPLGIGETVTAGIISAKGRQTGLSDGNFEDFLQTDAPINQGNSGGALVNTRAELVGINSQILSPNGGGNIGIGFAIPSNMAKNVMNQLISRGTVSRGQLGVTAQYITSDLAASLGLRQVQGVLVGGVAAGGPAEKAGIKSGDIILEVNGAAVNDVNALRNHIASTGAGNDVDLTILRDGNRQKMKVKLEEFKAAAGSENENSGNNESQTANSVGRLGVGLTPLTPEIARQLNVSGITQGVVVASVDASGTAATAGIRESDVIQQVNRQPVRSSNDVESALGRSGDKPVLLQILRQGQSIFVAVPLR